MALGIGTLKMMLDGVIFFPDILHWRHNIGTSMGLSKFHEDSLIFEGKTTNLQVEHSSNYFVNADPHYASLPHRQKIIHGLDNRAIGLLY